MPVERRYLQGEVSTLLLEDEGKGAGDADALHSRGLSTSPHRLSTAASTLHLICSCDDLCSDEDVEVMHRHFIYLFFACARTSAWRICQLKVAKELVG